MARNKSLQETNTIFIYSRGDLCKAGTWPFTDLCAISAGDFFTFGVENFTSYRAPLGALSWVDFSANAGFGYQPEGEEATRLTSCPGTQKASPVNRVILASLRVRSVGACPPEGFTIGVFPEEKDVTVSLFKLKCVFTCSSSEVRRLCSEPVHFCLSRYESLKELDTFNFF